MTYDDILKKFNYQINKELEKQNENIDIENCISYWHRELFIISYNLTFEDWKAIRDENYWIVKDTLKHFPISSIKFTINEIKKYLKK